MKVLTFGHFSFVHAGHIHLFASSKNLDKNAELIVAVAADLVVCAAKGENTPVFPLQERLDIIKSIRYVDAVAVYGQNLSEDELFAPMSMADHYELLHDAEKEICELYSPDVITFGDDKDVSFYHHLRSYCANFVQLPRLISRPTSTDSREKAFYYPENAEEQGKNL